MLPLVSPAAENVSYTSDTITWSLSLSFLLFERIRKPNTAARNRPGVKHARRPTRLAGAGLQHHQPVVHVLQDFLVNGLQNVAQLEGVCSQVVHLHKHLVRGRRGHVTQQLRIGLDVGDITAKMCNNKNVSMNVALRNEIVFPSQFTSTSLSSNSQYCRLTEVATVRTHA